MIFHTGRCSDTEVQGFMKEAKVMSKYSHPNLLPLVGVTKHDGKYGMLSPFMDNGDLKKYLDDHEDYLVSD